MSAWKTYLESIKALVQQQGKPSPRVFISYAWEGDATQTAWLHDRLKQFHTDLTATGASVFLDILHITGDLKEAMQRELAQSDIVLVICTPMYARRIADPSTNVRYEFDITCKKLSDKTALIIPIWLAGEREQVVPKAFADLAIQDCRDWTQHEWQLGQFSEAPGVIATLYQVASNRKLSQSYTTVWQTYTQAEWQGQQPPSILNAVLKQSNNDKLTSATNLLLRCERQATCDSDSALDAWANSLATLQGTQRNNKCYLLFGDPEVTQEALHSIATILVAEKQSDRIPLYLPLKAAVSSKDTNFLSEWLINTCGYTTLELEQLRRVYSFVILLDGYEEFILAQGVRNIFEDAKLFDWNATIILSCHPQFEEDCRYLDNYLTAKQYPKAQRYYLGNCELPAFTLEGRAPQPTVTSPGHSVRHVVVQPIASSPVNQAPVLSHEQISQQWFRFLDGIKSMLPKAPTFYISSTAVDSTDEVTANRLLTLRRDLSRLGLQETEFESASFYIIACTTEYSEQIRRNADLRWQFQAILEKGRNNPNALLPLIISGTGWQVLPKELRHILVRDVRQERQYGWQVGSLQEPLGLIPALYGLQNSVHPQRQAYQERWQQFADAVWGKGGSPTQLLDNLRTASRRYAAFETSYQQSRAYYIHPTARHGREETSPKLGMQMVWEQQVLPAAQGQANLSRLHIVFGDPGGGKSAALLNLEEELWNNLHQYNLVPIRIPLNQIPKQPANFLQYWLETVCQYTSGEVTRLKAEYRFVFLLDSFDELVFSQGTRELLQEADLLTWPAAIVVSCRTQLEPECGALEGTLMRAGLLRAERYFICPFETPQITDYLQKRGRQQPSLTPAVQQQLLGFPGLQALIQNPLILYMVVDIFPDLVSLNAKDEISRYKIYELFTDKWFVREFAKIVHDGSLGILYGERATQVETRLLQYAEHLAILMFQTQQVAIEQTELEAAGKSFLQSHLVSEQSEQQAQILRNACPLKAMGTTYQFVHKSFQEFLVAQALNKAIGLDNRFAEAEFEQHLSTLADNLWNRLIVMREREVVNFLADFEPERERLVKMMRASRGEALNPGAKTIKYRGNPAVAQAAGNAITVFTACQYSAGGSDLAYAHFTNADVSGGVFYNLHAPYSVWRKVRAEQTHWGTANLQHAALDINFGEQPYLFRIGRYSSKYKALGYSRDMQVLALSISPTNPDLVAAAHGDNRIVIWSLSQQALIAEWNVHQDAGVADLRTLAYLPDGEHLLTAGVSGIKLWDIKRKKLLRTFQDPKGNIAVTAMAVLNSERVVAAHANQIIVWDVANARTINVLVNTDSARKLTALSLFTPQDVIVGYDNGILQRWNLTRGVCEQTWHEHTLCITCIGILDQETFISSSADHTLRVWSVKMEKSLQVIIDPQHTINDLVVVNKQYIVTATEEKILKLWHITTGVCQKVFSGHVARVRCIKKIDNTLISGGDDRTLRIWKIDLDAGDQLISAKINPHSLVCIEFFNDKYFISVDSEHRIQLWQAINHKIVRSFTENSEPIKQIIIMDTQHFVTVSNTFVIKVWHIEKSEALITFTINSTVVEDEMYYKPSVVIKLGEHKLVSAHSRFHNTYAGHSGSELRVWDIRTGQCINRVDGEYSGIQALIYLSGHILSVDAKGSLLGWWQVSAQQVSFITGTSLYSDYKKILAAELIEQDRFILVRATENTNTESDDSSEDYSLMVHIWSVYQKHRMQNFKIPLLRGGKYKTLFRTFSCPQQPYIQLIFSSCCLLTVFDTKSVKVLATYPLPSYSAITFDKETGQLLLLLDDGALWYAKMNRSAGNPYTPSWEFQWNLGITPLNLSQAKIKNSSAISALNKRLWQQRGAEGNTNVLNNIRE